MSHDPGANADATVTSRFGRSVAQIDASRLDALDELCGALGRAHQHEVRRALPIPEMEPVARRVEQGLRFSHLTTVIASRIGSSRAAAPTRQPIRRPARPNAFENVRPTITFGNDGNSGMNVSP